jgi:NAD dependent epimerase/dehydratase family enzyme
MFRAAVADERYRGAYNAVAPEPVTNVEFTRALGHVLHRPTIFPIPAAALQAMFGEMAGEMLLASQRVKPKRADQNGYSYSYPELEPALRAALD